MESLEWEQRIMQIKALLPYSFIQSDWHGADGLPIGKLEQDNIFLEIQLRNLMRGPLFLNTPQ